MYKLTALPLYNAERARRLHHICQVLARRVTQGETFRHAAKHLARRWNGKPYKTCPRIFTIGLRQLYRAFKKWKTARSPEVFNLSYHGKKADYSPLSKQFIAICLNPDVTFFRTAVRLLNKTQPLPVSQRKGYRFLTVKQRMAVQTMFKARRQVRREEHAFRVLIESKPQ